MISRRRTGDAARALALFAAIALGALARPAALGAPARQEPGAAPGARVYLPVAHNGDHEPASPLGIQLSELRFRDPALLADAHGAGVAWWRTFLFWDEVEPVRTEPPTYDFAAYDALFGHARSMGLEIVAEIQGNPRWAAPFPGGPVDDLEALAEFMAAAVERYDGDGVRDAPGRPVIRHWEMYNEPDNRSAALATQGRGWGFWGDRGADYARMLQRVTPVIKLADPGAVVVFGGVAWESVPSEGDPFDMDFTHDVLTAGGGRFFDVFNFHYYPLFAAAWERPGLVDVAGKVAAARELLAAHGVSKPIFVTEAGAWSGAEPPYPPATPRAQARYVPQLYARAMAAGVEMVVWFQYDDVRGVKDPDRGLVDYDLRPKPARRAFLEVARRLAGGQPEQPSRQADAAGEVYWFRRRGHRVAVAWTDGPIARLRLRAAAAERVHYLGDALTLRDADDGRADGIVEVPYGPDPVYVVVAGGAR